MTHEIHSAAALTDLLGSVADMEGVRLQSLDLTGDAGTALAAYPGSLEGLVVLGGLVPPPLLHHLIHRGAVVFPSDPKVPFNPYRSHLYRADDLYDALADGYEATADARNYRWLQSTAGASDAYCAALRALHDEAIRDSLGEITATRSSVGVMGGHAWRRDTAEYAQVAHATKRMADAGHVVITGGGPGAMEAANLGAATRTDGLEDALETLAQVPSFAQDITAWARAAFDARQRIMPAEVAARRLKAHEIRSLSVPTWFYGHEPPNVFGDAIAKYFSNALREDDLLANSHCALVVLPGAAGTVQEIFQALTPLYYAPDGAPLPNIILVGEAQWTTDVPIWPALQSLAAGRRMKDSLTLVDDVRDAAALVAQMKVSG